MFDTKDLNYDQYSFHRIWTNYFSPQEYKDKFIDGGFDFDKKTQQKIDKGNMLHEILHQVNRDKSAMYDRDYIESFAGDIDRYNGETLELDDAFYKWIMRGIAAWTGSPYKVRESEYEVATVIRVDKGYEQYDLAVDCIIDAIVEVNGRYGLIDFKTSSRSVSKFGLEYLTKQLHFYKLILEKAKYPNPISFMKGFFFLPNKVTEVDIPYEPELKTVLLEMCDCLKHNKDTNHFPKTFKLF